MSDQVSNERKTSEERETSEERADRELIELLNDLRVALPGVQVDHARAAGAPTGRTGRAVLDRGARSGLTRAAQASVSSTASTSSSCG